MLQLAAGQVFHLWCRSCVPPKWKFYVLAHLNPRPRYFLINSNPAPFQQANPQLMTHQIRLAQVQHPFLRRDSVLDCSQVVGGYTASELEDAYNADPGMLIGTVDVTPRTTARSIIANSEILTGREIADILAEW